MDLEVGAAITGTLTATLPANASVSDKAGNATSATSPAVKIDMIREHEWKAMEAMLEPPVDLFSALPAATASAPSPRPAATVPVRAAVPQKPRSKFRREW